ncbi:polymer-forming cytoskeletal protein [Niveispirillum sp.]|uniref:polymer-forming cytoskeletal protein n=1 Tax=Niveispirillum sp. TaxID=1917217 RepID=UPI001B3ECFF1|nr:polymer-forming cytoskeletal protein [Niveispirillum sp.]MBP7337318.1 polymer-forming cytoskeletal protein [Niveispirillum sp.]
MFARFLIITTAALALSGLSARAADFWSGDDVRLIAPLSDNLVVAGHQVSVDAPVDGDVVAAGLELRITAPVSGDALVAGFDLSVKGPVAGDLAAAAFDLSVHSDIAGDALLTGMQVQLRPGAHVAGDLKASGSEVTLSGRVDGDAILRGDHVIVDGFIAGDLDVTADMLELKPGTRVLGDLRHTGPAAVEVPDGVSVGGTVRYHHGSSVDEGPTVLGTLGKAVALFLLGVGILWLLPGPVTRAADGLRRRPLRHFLVGTAILLLSPPLLALLMVSVVGIPLGLLLLGLWLFCLPLGLAVSGFGLALCIRRGATVRPGTEAGMLMRRYAVSVLALTLLSMLPVAGWVVLAVAAALGLGALADTLLRSRRGGLAAG